MLPPPPRSTLFPYTTLFRSSRTLLAPCGSTRYAPKPSPSCQLRAHGPPRQSCGPPLRHACRSWCCPLPISATTGSSNIRSEEHTSELQSLTNLVCRLLLEKK